MTTPCAGQWRLFDSTDPFDHQRAAELCAACPLLAECTEQLQAAQQKAVRSDYGPTGTWAGRLVGNDRYNPERLKAEEHMFTPDELRAAHSAYARGERDPRALMGERIYQRKRKRGNREGFFRCGHEMEGNRIKNGDYWRCAECHRSREVERRAVA